MPSPGVVQVTYTSNPVAIPPGFLTKPPADARPITTSRIDFANSPLPQYKDAYALVLENVLSLSECATLLALAEQSATNRAAPWQPALVNVGMNRELAAPDYRNSDRIIWDEQAVVDRIIDRILAADNGRLARDVSSISPPGKESSKAAAFLARFVTRASDAEPGADPKAVLGPRAAQTQAWQVTRGNERMRFLRYRPGQFFDRHCDGSYVSPADPKTGKPEERTLFTVHLYLSGSEADAIGGGSTAFFGTMWGDGKKAEGRLDVMSTAGRVLVFQQRGKSCVLHLAGHRSSSRKQGSCTPVNRSRVARSIQCGLNYYTSGRTSTRARDRTGHRKYPDHGRTAAASVYE
jgi:hypothetical protein